MSTLDRSAPGRAMRQRLPFTLALSQAGIRPSPPHFHKGILYLYSYSLYSKLARSCPVRSRLRPHQLRAFAKWKSMECPCRLTTGTSTHVRTVHHAQLRRSSTDTAEAESYGESLSKRNSAACASLVSAIARCSSCPRISPTQLLPCRPTRTAATKQEAQKP